MKPGWAGAATGPQWGRPERRQPHNDYLGIAEIWRLTNAAVGIFGRAFVLNPTAVSTAGLSAVGWFEEAAAAPTAEVRRLAGLLQAAPAAARHMLRTETF